MAYLVLKNGKKLAISKQAAEKLWISLRDPSQLPDKEIAKLEKVKAVYLNWHTAPDDYVKENLEWIIPMAANEWIVDRKGRNLRPEKGAAMTFAIRWGLYEFGQATGLVPNRAIILPTDPFPARAMPVNDQ